jgi:hypothetical protein
MLADPHGGNELARETLAACGEHDPDLLTTLVPVYAAWVYTSMLVALPRRPEIAGLPWEERFAWLRATARGSA